MVKITPTINGKAGPDILVSVGPRLQVQIELTTILAGQFQKTGNPIPSPIPGHAIIDTGSPVTAVDIGVLQKLGLAPTGVTDDEFGYGAEKKRREIYTVRAVFPGINLGPFDPCDVAALDLMSITYRWGSTDTIMIIGRDVLKNIVLTYNGPEGTFTLTD